MVDTKPMAEVQANWEGSIGRVPTSYATGIGRTTNWNAKAIAGEDNYAAGVTEAVAAKRRAAKLAEVSDAEWKAAALDKGAKRIGAGMTAAKGKYARKMGEVINVIQGVSIADRTQDIDANIDGRVKPIAHALHSHFK